jgi:hypothetical protein
LAGALRQCVPNASCGLKKTSREHPRSGRLIIFIDQ